MVVQIRRPKAVVFDILGTASKSGFLERILFPYLKSNMDTYLDSHWNKKDFVTLYKKIMEQSIEFNKQESNTPVVTPHYTGEARASLLNFINFVTDNGVNSTAVTQLRFRIWFEGYQQSKIKTPIYSDVPTKLKQWFAEGIKFYVYSNTWVAAQKALLKNTNHGDLTNLISGHFDNESFGALLESSSWKKLAHDIKENPNDILFLTKNPAEARAAAEAGYLVVLVLTHRHNVKAIPAEDLQRFPYVRTLLELEWLEGAMNPAAPTGASVAPSEQQVRAVPTAISELPTGSQAASGRSHSRTGVSSTAGQQISAKGSTATATATGTVPESSAGKQHSASASASASTAKH